MEKQKKTYEYRTVPLDPEAHGMLMELCQAYEMGQRAQGAMVKKLVKAEHSKLKALNLDKPAVKEAGE